MTQFEARINELEYENSSLKRDLKIVLQLNQELRSENKQLKQKIEVLEVKVSKLQTELEKHKVKPNQPPSSKPYFEKNNSENPKTKPGQKLGHSGISRTTPQEIHKTVEYRLDSCQHCGSNELDQTPKPRSKVITDLEFKVVNTKEIYHDVICKTCGQKSMPVSIHGTSKSPFGKVFQTLITYLRSVGGVTIRPIENLFRDFFKLNVSDSSISNTEIRLSKYSLQEYNQYLELVKNAQFSHKDETSYRVNGKNHWVWVYDSIKHVFYRLDQSRGMTVLNTDFGLNSVQISINDCYAGYNRFKTQQICWAHLIREAEAHAEKENATIHERKLFYALQMLYKRAKDFVATDPNQELRQQERVALENTLSNIMRSLTTKSDFLERICHRLNERLMHCFLFVEIKGLPSTNNQAERSLRPFVIHRKISFGSKSIAGAQAKVIFKTIFENAKRQGQQLSNSLNHIYETKNIGVVKTT
jgi:transposase